MERREEAGEGASHYVSRRAKTEQNGLPGQWEI